MITRGVGILWSNSISHQLAFIFLCKVTHVVCSPTFLRDPINIACIYLHKLGVRVIGKIDKVQRWKIYQRHLHNYRNFVVRIIYHPIYFIWVGLGTALSFRSMDDLICCASKIVARKYSVVYGCHRGGKDYFTSSYSIPLFAIYVAMVIISHTNVCLIIPGTKSGWCVTF